jgi:hypothetical protein
LYAEQRERCRKAASREAVGGQGARGIKGVRVHEEGEDSREDEEGAGRGKIRSAWYVKERKNTST